MGSCVGPLICCGEVLALLRPRGALETKCIHSRFPRLLEKRVSGGGVDFRNATAACKGPFPARPLDCCKRLRRASKNRVSCGACCGRAEVQLKSLQQERELVASLCCLAIIMHHVCLPYILGISREIYCLIASDDYLSHMKDLRADGMQHAQPFQHDPRSEVDYPAL